MLDTKENIQVALKTWDELSISEGITEDEVMNSKYDYLDEDDKEKED